MSDKFITTVSEINKQLTTCSEMYYNKDIDDALDQLYTIQATLNELRSIIWSSSHISGLKG